MKKILLLLVVLVSSVTFAQNNGITYQAVIYSTTGESVPGIKNSNSPLSNKAICLQFSIVDENTQTEYQEKVTVTTDEYGMVNLVIGNGTQTGGYANSFNAIVWSNPNKYLKVSVDQTGNCSSFELISNQILTYVPFALSANSATSVSGIVGIANGGTNATTVVGAKTNLQLQNVDNTSDLNKPLSTATQTALNTKVDKVTGKDLSTEDFTTAEKTKLASLGGSPDLSGYATIVNLNTKVDKATGKDLSTNDYTTAEKTKLAAISGVNTGDQDLRLYATNANLALKAPLASPNFTGIMSLNNRAEFGQNIEREQPSLKLIGFSKAGTGVNSFWPTQPYAGGGLEIGDGGAVRLVIYRKSSNTFNISTTGSLNEGIGINADSYDPAYTLDINGTLGVRNSITSTGTITAGTVTYPNVDGTSGQVLATNGAGVAVWTSPSGGGSTTVGTISTSSNTKGASITAGEINLAPADATNGGIVTTGTQTFAGNKGIIGDLNVSGKVGLGTSTPDLESSLHISTALPVIFPSMSQTEINAISSPKLGMVQFNTTEKKLQVYSKNTTSITTVFGNATTTSSATCLTSGELWFRPTVSGNITKIELNAFGAGETASLVVKSANSCGTPNNLGTSNSITCIDGWNTWTFATPVSVTAGTVYYITSNDANRCLGVRWSLSGDDVTTGNVDNNNMMGMGCSNDNFDPASRITVVQNVSNSNEWLSLFNTPTTSSTLIDVANGGTGSSTKNFVDLTTDQQIAGNKNFSSDILVNDITAGKGKGAIGSNTAFGSQALKENTTGFNNTAFGLNALNINTTGYGNTATGFASLASNSTGSENTANGAASLAQNSTGSQNTANGVNALYYNTTGNNNTANGLAALEGNTSGYDNTANGSRSLFSNRTGYNNTATGSNSLKLNTFGYGNTANGVSSLQTNVTGNENTAIGNNSLFKNTSGSGNTSNGVNSLYSNTTGVVNTANGTNSLYSNTLGYGNTATGYNSLSANTDGFHNTAIGNEANVGSGNLNNATAIGNGATVNASNAIQLGNTSVTNVKTSGTYTGSGFKTPTGTSSQYLMADGSVSNTSLINDLQSQITQLQSQIASLNFANGFFPKVTISNQVWSSKNLDVTTYRDGSTIPQVTDPTQWANLTTGAWCYANNDSNNNQTYGKLYNWFAINDPRGIAPAGYHVPTEADFVNLIANTGGSSQSGWALKEMGSTHWFNNYGEGSTNSSGFTAVGSGLRLSDGNFIQFNRLAIYHLSDSFTDSNGNYLPHYRVIRADDGEVFMDWIGLDPRNGFSVRLVKD